MDPGRQDTWHHTSRCRVLCTRRAFARPDHSQRVAVQVGEGRRPLGSQLRKPAQLPPHLWDAVQRPRYAYAAGESIGLAARQRAVKREGEREREATREICQRSWERVCPSLAPPLHYGNHNQATHPSFVQVKDHRSRASRAKRETREPAEIRRWVT